MRGNSGIIGPKQQTSTSAAIGLFDTYDQYTARISDTWQPTQKVLSVTNSNGTALNEETDNTITVSTEAISDSTTLYYTVATVSGTTLTSADFTTGDVSGSFTITSNSGSFVLRPKGDSISESNVAKIEIRRGSTSGEILAETGNLTIADAAASNPCGSGTYTIFTSTTTNSTSGPNIMNIWYRRHLIGFCYTASELAAANSCFSSGATISGISFYISNPTSSSYNPYPSYAIAMCHVPNGSNTSNPTSSSITRNNFTTVRSAGSQYFTSSGTKTISFSTNFSYNGTDALGFIFAWGQVPTGYSSDGQSRIQSSGRMYYARTDSTGSYNVFNSASSYQTYRPRVDLICS